jgi:hypothetical protein
VKNYLHLQQKFVIAGGFTGSLANQAMAVQSTGKPQADPQLSCNAEEADTRIWLHALNTTGRNILILSPDTDVYHIGLPLVANTDLNIIIQLNKFNSRELRLLDMQALVNALTNDPHLAPIPDSLIPRTLQILFCKYRM